MNITIGVSDLKVSANPSDVLVTHSLGSCIGVCLFDPVTRVAGLLHFQLPSSTLDPARASQSPAMFADTGMELLLATMAARGARQERLKVHLAGGASMIQDSAGLSIGKRNHTAIRKILWQKSLLITSENVGGSMPRTLFMPVATGEVTIKSAGLSMAA